VKITYDAEVDALYIQLRDIEDGTAENRDLAAGITADFGPDGLLAGIEIHYASRIIGSSLELALKELKYFHLNNPRGTAD